MITNKNMTRERDYQYKESDDPTQKQKRKRWKILSSNTKVDKDMPGYIGASLRLTADALYIDGKRVVTCPKSSQGCRSVCLTTSGHGGINDAVHNAAYQRTYAFHKDRDFFFSKLHHELVLAKKRATKLGKKLAVRLNSMSDLPIHFLFNQWLDKEGLSVDVDTWYDYTAVPKYIQANKDVHYTFSVKENNRADVMKALAEGVNLAVVVRDKSYDNNYGYNIVDGDITDARFLDPANSIVLLQSKGEAEKSESKFIFDNLKNFIEWLQK